MTACPLAAASARTVWSFSAAVTSISAGAVATDRPLIIEGYLMPGTFRLTSHARRDRRQVKQY
jgi:hypothetical protein